MRIFVLTVIAALLWSGCRGPEKAVHVTETRELTYHDRYYPGYLKDLPPLGWRRLPGTQYRVFNYVAGKDDSVEIVLGETSGGVLENAERWLGQFGIAEKPTFDSLKKTSFLGRQAVIVEASGTYAGMARGAAEGYSLIGLILARQGSQITLKMTGPTEEVEKQREAFFKYAADFEAIDDHYIPEGNLKKEEEFDE